MDKRRARSLPVYFRGKQQSAEFARGAWAALDLLIEIQARSDPATVSHYEVTEAVADRCFEHADVGGDFTRAFVTMLADLLAFHEAVGVPAPANWRPFQQPLTYGDDDSVTPPAGSRLFDVDGIPVSVAPDLTVHDWSGNPRKLKPGSERRVLREGREIDRATFDAMVAAAEEETSHG